jgi:hypothetical protein
MKKNGLTSQFAFVGTVDVYYVLRSALQLCHEHDIDSHDVHFVDLIKAFDTANHEMLFALLEKVGAPTALVEPIRKVLNKEITLLHLHSSSSSCKAWPCAWKQNT